jgi:hypothetical protein
MECKSYRTTQTISPIVCEFAPGLYVLLSALFLKYKNHYETGLISNVQAISMRAVTSSSSLCVFCGWWNLA